MKTLFLITARGGSKGVPGKNLKQIGGLSLIGWKAAAAKGAINIIAESETPPECRLVISTDCPEIQKEAATHGVEVPFTRPATLASDTASSGDTIKHTLNWFKEHENTNFDTVVLLEPSAPFATAYHISEAYWKYKSVNASLVAGMKELDTHSSFIGTMYPNGTLAAIITKMKKYSDDTRRQARAQEWTMNGALYIFDPRALENSGDIYGIVDSSTGPDENNRITVKIHEQMGYLMDRWHSIEIDNPHDLEMAEYAVAKGYVKVPQTRIMDRAFSLLRGR